MVTPVQVGIAAGAVGAGYLIYDAVSSSKKPGESGVSIVQRVSNTVSNAVASTMGGVPTVPAVKVGMPRIASVGGASPVVDSGSNTHNNLSAISVLCTRILCDNVGNGGDVAAAFASCESQRGSLANACYNCSLFNIHWTPGETKPPFFISGSSEKLISFRTGEADDVDGFYACITHFKAFLQRRSPDALTAIRARDFDGFQVAISRIGYSGAYTDSVRNGTLVDPFIRRRYERLVAAGLLPQRG